MNNNAKLIAMSLALFSASTVFGQKILRMEDDPVTQLFWQSMG